ncbi:Tab2/Atab2 family RNA-binding protein [Romeria aff. gracilis LEGE 07310]|uniref:Tab2/Atab2 family RNA-binding protein n=1 Tax=Vasconcelosia minhoensis LEGE 07310 TaxID=915328 RepID=A0A8J7AL43_9CYAN|nr:Tab2/Atab2 family RNA-binding protein [Romeria gracilis]MBE9076644.1 Tab2/Atab2 family RNA-binding protein [Romeria aff. gracilis LEGE 07310]
MATVWELDFYSRPILDERQKKRWEILICEGAQSVDEPDQRFRYSKFVSSSEVNSITLRDAIADALTQAPTPPSRIRFFRYAMQNMIVRACEELGLPAKISRRTLALQQWLEVRQQQVYPQQPGYQPGGNPSVSRPIEVSKPLPDALQGQQWALVTLPAQDFADMDEWPIDFGEGFPLALAGIDEKRPIPGFIIFSQRAVPLAGWMSGLELAYLKAEGGAPVSAAQLLLETGATDTWILANLGTAELQAEGQRFEAAKQAAGGVHFLAVQQRPEAEQFAGFWLMQERGFG